MRRRHFVYGTFALVAFIGAAIAQPPSPAPWTMPEVSALPRDARGQLIRDGRDIMLATYAFIGPNVDDPAKRFAGNNLACTNCHLSGGTTKFGLPLFGIYNDFPAYSARTGGPAVRFPSTSYWPPLWSEASSCRGSSLSRCGQQTIRNRRSAWVACGPRFRSSNGPPGCSSRRSRPSARLRPRCPNACFGRRDQEARCAFSSSGPA